MEQQNQNEESRVTGPDRVAKRLHARDRAIAKGSQSPARSEALGTGPANRHAMPKLPIGQRQVTNWPRLDLGVIPEISKQTWRLGVTGLVERALEFSFDDLLSLPQVTEESDFHCVTGWSQMDMQFTGVRFTTLCDRVGAKTDAAFVAFEGADREPMSGLPYTTSLPLEECQHPDVLLVHSFEGRDLPAEHGGPVRLITPRLYAWKGTKWLTRITFLAQDRLGFWEERGYSNSADPWRDDRYAPGRP